MAYIALALMGLIPLGLAVWRRRDPALVATWSTASGVIMLADWVVFGIFHLYDYMPGLVADKGVDSMLGVFLAELFFVTSLAVLQAVYLPGWKGPLAATGLLLLIEYLFLRWGIFWQRGWPLWASAALFPIYLGLTQLYWRWALATGLARGGPRFLFRAMLAFLLVALYTSILRIGGLTQTNLQIFPLDESNGSMIRLLFYGLIAAPLALWTMMAGRVTRWQRLAGVVLLLIGLLYLTGAAGIMSFAPPWHPVLDALGQGVTIGFAFLLDDWVSAWAAPVRRPIG